MRVLTCVLAVVLLAGGSVAQGQVRVEIGARDVTSITGTSGEAYGFGVRSALPIIEAGHELLVAMLWLEVSAETADLGKATPDRGCIAGARFAEGVVAWREPALPEVTVPSGKTRTVCIDVTQLVREQVAAKAADVVLAIVPCNDADAVASVGVLENSAIVGWIEYSFFDAGKRERMLAK